MNVDTMFMEIVEQEKETFLSVNQRDQLKLIRSMLDARIERLEAKPAEVEKMKTSDKPKKRFQFPGPCSGHNDDGTGCCKDFFG